MVRLQSTENHQHQNQTPESPIQIAMMNGAGGNEQLVILNQKVAALLHHEHPPIPLLSAEHCQTVISTFKRMQRARDAEIIQTLKPFVDTLDELLPRFRTWELLCHGSGLSQPLAALRFKLENLTMTHMGMKPGAFLLEYDVLLTMQASNKILRALAVEKKYIGLSRPMSMLKRNVQQLMTDVQNLLGKVIEAHQPVPGARFRPVLDATRGEVVLVRGRPFYVDSQDENLLVTCGTRHPMIKAPGSEWNKWFKIPRHLLELSDMIRIPIPDGPFRHLREQFLEARMINSHNRDAYRAACRSNFANAGQARIFREFLDGLTGPYSLGQTPANDVDLDYVEKLDWNMHSYLTMMDHHEVDYTLLPPESDIEPGLWWSILRGPEQLELLHPGYRHRLWRAGTLIDHPCEFGVLDELVVDFSKMSLTPEEANGALTPYLYEDAALGNDFEHDLRGVDEIPGGPFAREGLYLDTHRVRLRFQDLIFINPEDREQF